jgi:hypothetical protein
MGARHRQLSRLEVERLDPAGLDQGSSRRTVDAAPEVRDAVRLAEAADQRAVDVDLDDVATVDALLDPAADLADENRAGLPGIGRAGRAAAPGR